MDLVADLYWPDSIKGPTKKKRGTASGVHFSGEDILPKKTKLDQYLTNDEFKADLNGLIFDVVTEAEDFDTDLDIVITDGLKIMKISNGVHIRGQWSDVKELMEEADNRVKWSNGGRSYSSLEEFLASSLQPKLLLWDSYEIPRIAQGVQ